MTVRTLASSSYNIKWSMGDMHTRFGTCTQTKCKGLRGTTRNHRNRFVRLRLLDNRIECAKLVCIVRTVHENG